MRHRNVLDTNSKMKHAKVESESCTHSGKLTDTSLFEKLYGKRVKYLSEASKLAEWTTKADLEKMEDSTVKEVGSRNAEKKRSLKTSLEGGSWVYKLKRSGLEKHKVGTECKDYP